MESILFAGCLVMLVYISIKLSTVDDKDNE